MLIANYIQDSVITSEPVFSGQGIVEFVAFVVLAVILLTVFKEAIIKKKEQGW